LDSKLAAQTDPGWARVLCRWLRPYLDGHASIREIEWAGASQRSVARHLPGVMKVAHSIPRSRSYTAEIARDALVGASSLTNSRETRGSYYTRILRIFAKVRLRFLRAKRSFHEGASRGTHSQRNMLKDALTRIPDEDRCLLLLRELHGYSVAQLSEVTGLDEFAVRNRLFATRQRLVKDLGRQA
jgi:DNA-directed RNA polymerase specialized sigma24 family protein